MGEEENQGFYLIKVILIFLSLSMVSCGIAATFYFLNFLYQVLEHPENVHFIDFLLNKLPSGPDGFSISGEVEGKSFTVSLSQSLGNVFITMLVIFGIGAFSNLARGLIEGGVRLIIFIISPSKEKKEKSSWLNRSRV